MYIGIDLGGTNIVVGIVGEDCKIIAEETTPTLAERPHSEIVDDMARLINKLLEENNIAKSDIKGIGIGSPGSIDYATGTVVYSNNLRMDHFPLAEELEKRVGIAVKVDNDANCAAMGEYMVTGKGVDNFVFVTLGTGVGGGIIANGKMIRGFNGAGGEVGHISIAMDGEKCNCGNVGCWERYASVTALINQTKEAIEAHPDSLMKQYADRDGKVTGRTAFDAAKAGDKAGQEVVDNYRRYVAVGIVSLINIFQPEIVAVGGGISKEGDYLLDDVRKYVAEHEYNKYLDSTKIVTATLFNDAGVIGAAMLAK